MGFFKTRAHSQVAPQQTYNSSPQKVPAQVQQFDINSVMAGNQQLNQSATTQTQPKYPLQYSLPNKSVTHVSFNNGRPLTAHGVTSVPTPAPTPPPALPPLQTNLSTQTDNGYNGQFEMSYTNSVTTPGVQNVSITQIQFPTKVNRASLQMPPGHYQQYNQAHMFINSNPAPFNMPAAPQHQPYTLPTGRPVHEMPQANRRYSMQHMSSNQTQGPPPPMGPFPSQLTLVTAQPQPPSLQRVYTAPNVMPTISTPPPQQQQQHAPECRPPSPEDIMMESQPMVPASEILNGPLPWNSDIRNVPVDDIYKSLRPMNLSEYLEITGEDDICRHIPLVDRAEGTISEFQHPDKESVVGQCYPLMNKLEWDRPRQQNFTDLMSWNGRRLIPYPQQTLGRMIRGEEDVASLADDFWIKPVHAATVAWLQAIDSSRSNGDYLRGPASRFTSTSYTNMDGIVEYNEDFDPSMLHFGKYFTLHPPAQQNTSSARRQVVFFIEFANPGVIGEDEQQQLWSEGPVRNLTNQVPKEFVHTYYSATRQIANTAKTTKCHAGAICDYENIILFYFHGPPETWTAQESKAEVLFLKRTDAHARYMMAELVYRSMSDMSEKLNLGSLSKVVEANQQLETRHGDFIYNSISVLR